MSQIQSFGEIIKDAREKRGMLLRHVGAELDIDQAIVSKLERGERKANKDQVTKFAELFELDVEMLLTAWMSDKIVYDLIGFENAQKVLKVAEKKIKYVSNKG
jgi:HTH-type transcriptional regulator, competence development regulator